ncbi:MAG TPA: helix-hairpin-helix domain-containing protein [Vicinamibacterales bacterium]|nr:helix-hairpin-helix domain-containing protein [Vicinamibacterales bacterium]
MFRTVFSLVAVAALFALVPPSAHAQTRSSSTAAAKAAVGVVNINTATVAELDALPGIGAKTAALIVEYRQKNGPFKKIEELMNVRGVGEKNFLKLKPQITVGTAKADHDRQNQ